MKQILITGADSYMFVRLPKKVVWRGFDVYKKLLISIL